MTKPARIDGVDISHFQSGNIDFRKAKEAGVKFVYHKATEGTTYRDDLYTRRRAECLKAGIPFGAYHFARPDGNDAVEEAAAFLNYARPKPGDLIPCLDFEVTFRDGEAWCKKFMAEVERVTGNKGIHYGPSDFGDDYPYARWVPRYNNSNTPPTVKWDMWQFSNGVYGVPNRVEGMGNVDLNTFAPNFGISKLLFRGPKSAKEVTRVTGMHASMQFSDGPAAMERDAKNIFKRARERDYWFVTGTEAGPGAGPLDSLLREYAEANGFRYWAQKSTDVWYAVAKDVIHGDWSTFTGPTIIDGEAKKYAGKRVTSVSFNNDAVGPVTIMAGHYLTNGRPNPAGAEYGVFTADNRRFALAIGDHAKLKGRGNGLVFYGGDQNIGDKRDDTFFGGPLTSLWDELGRWDNTGHGPIDVLASFDGDGRVEAHHCVALDDSEFRLDTDHFAIEGAWNVTNLV